MVVVLVATRSTKGTFDQEKLRGALLLVVGENSATATMNASSSDNNDLDISGTIKFDDCTKATAVVSTLRLDPRLPPHMTCKMLASCKRQDWSRKSVQS